MQKRIKNRKHQNEAEKQEPPREGGRSRRQRPKISRRGAFNRRPSWTPHYGWEIVSIKGSILNSSSLIQWEEKLKTSHLPEMVFGESCLVLKHASTGTKIHFNAFDALTGWKQEDLPPVEVPAAAKWKFRANHSSR